jgi:hypothetical protein
MKREMPFILTSRLLKQRERGDGEKSREKGEL